MFLFYVLIEEFMPPDSAFDGTFETPAYSLQKKNGVLRKCEVSEMLLIHRLQSKEPQFALICGHHENKLQDLGSSFDILSDFAFMALKFAMCRCH